MKSVILTAFRTEYSLEKNRARNERMLGEINRYLRQEPISCIGSWEGQEEESFIVQCKTQDDFDVICDIAEFHEQDAILVLNANAAPEVDAYLHFMEDGHCLDLGGWHKVSKEEAEACEGYTYIPSLHKYYVAR